MRRALALVVLSAACSGEVGRGDEPAAAPASETLTVRITAEEVGFGCTASTAASGTDVGNGGQLTIEDQEGVAIGTGTFELSATQCDWSATAEVTEAEFYRLSSGVEMVTLSQAEMDAADWQVNLHIGLRGAVEVVD